MNFRTSTLLGAATVVFALASLPSIPAAATGSLKLTGPDGQTRVEVSQYGPTSPSDTFWSIAQKTRPDPSISVYQMMAAIFEANPHAFSSDNYNSLEKGMILAIPSQDVIQAIPVSLAKSRAEQDDRAWQAMLKREAEKPTVAEVQAAANSQAVEKAEEELEQVNESLMQAQSRNLNLTDELGRALDQLVVIKNDNDNLKAKISDLNDRVATLEQELITAREQNQSLRQKVEQLEWEASQAALPPEEPPFITSPLGLGLISAIVTLLLLIGLWLVLKRKSNKANAADGAATTVAAAGAGAAAAVVATDTMADDADELAVHLDEPDDSIDSLLDAGDVDLEPEADLSGDDADMYVADDEPEPTPEPDDSQSLDDLWAEAMGEQEEGEARREDEDGLEEVDTVEPETDISADIEDELEPIEDAAPISADDDLDSLIADLESDIESDADARATIDEDVDDMAFETDSEEADVDALLAGLDADAEATEFAETDDALDSDASQVIEANSYAGLDDELNDALADMDLPDESDPDALLAELQDEVSADEAIEELPVISEQAQTTEIDLDAFQQSENADTDTELDAEPGAELDSELDDAMAEMDLPGTDDADAEALLAELQNDTPTESAEQSDDAGIDTELDAEAGAELDTELDDAMAEMDLPGTDDVDAEALLAELQNDTPIESAEQNDGGIYSELDAELDAESGAELDSELDDAMAEMDLPGTDDADALLAELQNDTPTESADQSEDADIDTELDAEQGAEPGAELDSELDDAMAEMDLPGTDDADAEALLAELQNDTPTESADQSDDADIDTELDAEQGAEPGAELDSELDDAMAEMDLPGTDDVDAEALLADLQNDTPTESADQSDDADIDSELDAEQGAEPRAELDSELDDAMAEMDLPGTDDADAEALLAELQNDTLTESADQSDDADIDTELDAEQGAEPGAELDSELDDAMAEMDLPGTDDVDAEALLAELQNDTPTESAEQNDDAGIDTELGAEQGAEAGTELDTELDDAMAEMDLPAADDTDAEALLAGLQTQNTEESADIDAQAADYDSGADGLEAEVQTPDVSDLGAAAELGTSEVPVAEADEADVEALVAALESDPADEEIERKLEEEARQTTPEQISTELGDSDIAQNELSESTSDAEEIQMTQEDSAGGDSPEMPQTLSEVEPAIEELAESEQSLDALLDPELTQQTDVTEPFDTDSAELSEPEPVQELDDMLADLASTDDADSIADPQAEETLDALAEPADETSELAEEGLPSNDNAELLDDTPVLDESATLSAEADTDIALEAEPLDGDNLLPVDGSAVEAQAVEGGELTSLDDPMAELEQLQQESQVQSPESDPLAELQELKTSNSAYTGESLDDDLLDELGSDEAQTFSADELDALDDNGDPIQQGVNPSVVANVDPSEVMNMSSLERSERAMDEAMSRSELRAMHRAEALARAKAAEEDEIEVTDDELAEMASMTPTQPVVTETQDDPFGDALSLDQHDAEMSLSDEELLAAFAENSEESGETDTDIESGVDTSNMTVAEALAALDAKEKAQKQELAQEAETSPQVEPPRQAHFDENDLANFQKENGYIDIDRLLNEADESEDVDNYQGPSDVAMNGYPNMVGNSAMVDVDDEENSVNAKLDLARAYIEIDDNDSARALLQEVAIDGNDRQQDEARSLMEKIG